MQPKLPCAGIAKGGLGGTGRWSGGIALKSRRFGWNGVFHGARIEAGGFMPSECLPSEGLPPSAGAGLLSSHEMVPSIKHSDMLFNPPTDTAWPMPPPPIPEAHREKKPRTSPPSTLGTIQRPPPQDQRTPPAKHNQSHGINKQVLDLVDHHSLTGIAHQNIQQALVQRCNRHPESNRKLGPQCLLLGHNKFRHHQSINHSERDHPRVTGSISLGVTGQGIQNRFDNSTRAAQ
ncbi:uncharacterized protein BDCG_16200 [Blastomyces dermatitidis ER-3]|nr:uncharacterized protein BDCG_16200 [Blastomyces dermatitidis ER-3]OAS99552.1 hypothetical protein BDCG_16200 [Blastomyces dermatitidis ER-3]